MAREGMRGKEGRIREEIVMTGDEDSEEKSAGGCWGLADHLVRLEERRWGQLWPRHPGSSSVLVRAIWTSCVHTGVYPTLWGAAAPVLCRTCLALEGMIALIPDGPMFPLTLACARDRFPGDRMVSADGSPFHTVVARGG